MANVDEVSFVLHAQSCPARIVPHQSHLALLEIYKDRICLLDFKSRNMSQEKRSSGRDHAFIYQINRITDPSNQRSGHHKFTFTQFVHLPRNPILFIPANKTSSRPSSLYIVVSIRTSMGRATLTLGKTLGYIVSRTQRAGERTVEVIHPTPGARHLSSPED